MWCASEQTPIQLITPSTTYLAQSSKGMVENEREAGAVDCKFPNVRKTYWRSATWSSHSAPPSPKLPLEGIGSIVAPPEASVLPSTPRVQEHTQSTRSSRALLPPLQPLSIARKSQKEWPSAGLDDLGSEWLTVPATPSNRKAKNGLDIKLDLASIHRNAVEPTEIQLKRNKFTHFDKQCSRVANYHIYLGSDAVARDREALRANGITHVLNCVGFVCPEYFKEELIYKTLWLQDSPCEDITSLLYDVFDYFEDVKNQGGRVFVHCCQGVSRSTSLVIAYRMWREHSSFDDAFQDVKAARGVTNPNMGFACQLLQCQKRVHATPMSPNSVLRMYRLAPHNPYDPLHLVPKALNNPGARCLDSRGAFVIQLPARILVWIGRECDSKIAQTAREAADQVVRYERTDGPIHVRFEGREGSDFWESFSKYSLSREDLSRADINANSLESNLHAEIEVDTDHSEVERVRQLGDGNRKVPLYDNDYVLYRTARQGGVIPPVPFSGIGVGDVPTRIPARDDGWSLLRRKFLTGKLVSSKDTASCRKLRVGELSPCTSGDSVSLSSLMSASSSAAEGGSESPYLSPVSQFGDLSPEPLQTPITPFATPVAHFGKLSPRSPHTPYATPVSRLRKLSPDSFHTHGSAALLPIGLSPSHPYHPLIGSLYIPPPGKNQATQSAIKSSASSTSSLAQRRGSAAPSLQVPGTENNPPPAPRGMSRKPKLPPIVTAEKSKADPESDEGETNHFRLEALGEICKSIAEESQGHMAQELASCEGLLDNRVNTAEEARLPISCADDLLTGSASAAGGDTEISGERMTVRAITEAGHALLYLWPGLERIDMFDADDYTASVCILLAGAGASCAEGNNVGVQIFVWVGRQCAESEVQTTDTCSEGHAIWHLVGRQFLARMQLPSDTPIKVVHQGQETEDFRTCSMKVNHRPRDNLEWDDSI